MCFSLAATSVPLLLGYSPPQLLPPEVDAEQHLALDGEPRQGVLLSLTAPREPKAPPSRVWVTRTKRSAALRKTKVPSSTDASRQISFVSQHSQANKRLQSSQKVYLSTRRFILYSLWKWLFCVNMFLFVHYYFIFLVKSHFTSTY